jgi:hypothetical protein
MPTNVIMPALELAQLGCAAMLKDGWKSVGSASPLQRAEKRRIHMNLSDGRSS